MGKKRTNVTGWDDGRTASAAVLRPLMAFAKARGVDVDSLLAELGLSIAELDDLDHRIPESLRTRAWREVSSRVRDPALGLHVAGHAAVGAYDVLDYALCYSATLGEGIERILRFHRVLCDAWDSALDADGQVARLRRSVVESERHEEEVFFAVIVLHARQVTGHPDLSPSEVRFAHAAPADVTQHEQLFRSPVQFRSAISEMVFASKDLAIPALRSDPGLALILDRYMTELLARLPDPGSFTHRVRAIVAERLRGGRPTLVSTALALRASPRSVQRRLRELGTGHTQIVDEVRRDLAARLVDERRMSITEIAFLLGFADVSGFRRTFQRWTGKSPASHRREAAAALAASRAADRRHPSPQ